METSPPHNQNAEIADDIQTLHRLGYAQELARCLSGFSNFAISLSIICILAGGLTSFFTSALAVSVVPPLESVGRWHVCFRWLLL